MTKSFLKKQQRQSTLLPLLILTTITSLNPSDENNRLTKFFTNKQHLLDLVLQYTASAQRSVTVTD
jgi:hypothetical protein